MGTADVNSYPRSRIDDIQNGRAGIRFSYFLKHLLVLHAARAESAQGLRATANRRLVGMQISQRRQSSLRAKPRAARQNCFVGGARHEQQMRVSVAQLVVFVHGRQLPLAVRHLHATKLILQLEVIPASRLRQLFAARRVLEAVKTLDVHWGRRRRRWV